MNLWPARNPAARAEAAIMSPIANWFISTKTSKPVNGQVQDSNFGSYELTRGQVRLDRYHAQQLFATAGVEIPDFGAAAEFSGREAVSLLFRLSPVSYRKAPSSFNEVYAPHVATPADEMMTVFEQGTMVGGVLDKKSVGAKASEGLFHLVAREYGAQRALDMIFALQQVALQFLLWRGFTVGPTDLLPGAASLAEIRKLVAVALGSSREITERLLQGQVEAPIDSTVHNFYERLQIGEALKVPDAQMMRWILSSISPDTNGFFRMIATGSKGSNANFIHVSGAIGQTLINGDRIREGFAFRRTLPYFPRFATGPAAYGYVCNGYMTGMTAAEFLFQDMNGRFDLINKALSTASTGYFTRKGVMCNQSSVVNNLRQVAKDTKIVQFLYGEDGVDSRELERVDFGMVARSDAAVREAVVGGLAFAGPAQAALDAALAQVLADRDMFRATAMRIEQSNFGSAFASELMMPVNVRRILEGVFIAKKNRADKEGAPAKKGGATGEAVDPETLTARIERVRDLCERVPYILINEVQERRRSKVPRVLLAASALLCMLIRAELTPVVLARLTDPELDWIVDAVRRRYGLSLVDYGTAAGILAAQSVGEPLTQYMLDSHHRSVAGGTNKSGLVRVNEIFGARRVEVEKAPAMQLMLRPGPDGKPVSQAAAQEIANRIEYVTLNEFTRRFDVLLEKFPRAGGALTFPAYARDADWIAEFARNHPLAAAPGDLTNWCLRFEISKSALVLKAVDLDLIVSRLRRLHPHLYVVHTQEAAPLVVVRCWLRAPLFKRGGAEEPVALELLEHVFATAVRGIRGVLRAQAKAVQRRFVGADGSLQKEDRMAIATVGTNLYKTLLHGAVDPAQAVSNSIGDTLRLFGIEAARAKIISETRSFMEANAPNMRHVQLYADEMTRTGRVTAIEAAGLAQREKSNVLLRMANGWTIDTLREVALNATKSHVHGIAGPQLLGAIPQIGTLYNTCTVDSKFVAANTRSVETVLDEI